MIQSRPKVGVDGVIAIAFMGDHHLVVRATRPDEGAVYSNYIIEPIPPVSGSAGIGTYGLRALKEALYELKERANDYDLGTTDDVACEHGVSFSTDCSACDVEYARNYGELVPA